MKDRNELTPTGKSIFEKPTILNLKRDPASRTSPSPNQIGKPATQRREVKQEHDQIRERMNVESQSSDGKNDTNSNKLSMSPK